jgi:hypothetical protein
VVDKVALGQVFPQVLRFFSVNFIPPLLHYLEKLKKLIIFVSGLRNKPQGCGASVASAAGPSKNINDTETLVIQFRIAVSYCVLYSMLILSDIIGSWGLF